MAKGQENDIITLKEFTEPQQEKFDRTVEYAANEIGLVFDRKIRELFEQVTVNIQGKISISVPNIVEVCGDYEEVNLMDWKIIISNYNEDAQYDAEAKLVEVILRRLQEKFKEWQVTTFHRGGVLFIEINPKFMPVEIITSVDFDVAWELTCEKMIQYFLGIITAFIVERCGKRSSNGVMSITNVNCITNGISMSTDDGQRVFDEVNAHLRKNGWQIKQTGSQVGGALYADQAYDIELIKI